MVEVLAKEKSEAQLANSGTWGESVALLGEPSSFLSCIAELLRGEPSVHICSELHSERALRVALCEQPVGSLLVNYGVNTVGFLEVARRSNFPMSAILLLNVPLCAWNLLRFVRLGLKHILAHDSRYEEIVRTLQGLHRVPFYFSPSVAQHLALARAHSHKSGEVFSALSTREWQTAQAISQGYSATAIAERFSLSPKTVQTYRYRIFRKLNVCSDVQLTLLTQRIFPENRQLVSLADIQ